MPQPSDGQRRYELRQELAHLELRIQKLNSTDWELFSQDFVLELISVLQKGL